MSWDAELVQGRCPHCGMGGVVYENNYTHNCNRMANDVIGAKDFAPDVLDVIGDKMRHDLSWYWLLNGLTGEQGASYLNSIVTGLLADPDKYIAMNPFNKWGDYYQFVAILTEMQVVSENNPTAVWTTSG